MSPVPFVDEWVFDLMLDRAAKNDKKPISYIAYLVNGYICLVLLILHKQSQFSIVHIGYILVLFEEVKPLQQLDYTI